MLKIFKHMAHNFTMRGMKMEKSLGFEKEGFLGRNAEPERNRLTLGRFSGKTQEIHS